MILRYWWLELMRVILALTLVVSGVVKAIDPMGTISKVAEYQSSIFGVTSPTLLGLSTLMAVLLITLEFSVGAWLLAGAL